MLYGAYFLLATCSHEAAAGRPTEQLAAWTPPFTWAMPMCPSALAATLPTMCELGKALLWRLHLSPDSTCFLLWPRECWIVCI